VIHQHQFGRIGRHQGLQLGELAGTDQVAGVDLAEVGGELAGQFGPGGKRQGREFLLFLWQRRPAGARI
jgi:hypothetical protein